MGLYFLITDFLKLNLNCNNLLKWFNVKLRRIELRLFQTRYFCPRRPVVSPVLQLSHRRILCYLARLCRLCRVLGLLIAVGSTSWEIFSSLIFIEKMTEGWASRQPIRYLFSFIFLERGKIPTISSVCSHLLSGGLQPVPVCGRPGRHIDSVLPSPASHEDTISSLALLTPASCHLALIGTFQIRSENLAAFI